MPSRPDYFSVDFDQTPYVVAWEMSRARALTGDPLGPDPTCAYEPGRGVGPLPATEAVFGSGAPAADSLAGAAG